jgi:DNA-binding transcriptional MerR regulator
LGKELDGFIRPFRTSGGQRRYGLKDLSIIREVKELRTRNISLTEIKSHLQIESQYVVKRPQLGNIDLLVERAGEVI